MSECTHDCSTCGESCSERQEPQSLLKEHHPEAHIGKVFGIVSGKGGVGKSMVTSQLAVTMRRRGHQVGILDADVTGPSIPKAFGVHGQATGSEAGLYPMVSKTGIQVMSTNLLLPNETDPVIWRGPVISGVVQQFWTDVLWNCDYLFVDMPPGTGDVSLSVFQSIPLDGIVIVASPQELVSMVVEKAVKMAEMMEVPIVGLVENMSYVKCPDCGREIHVFGESHIDEAGMRELLRQVEGLYFPKYAVRFEPERIPQLTAEEVIDAFTAAAADFYEKKEQEFTSPVMREVERVVLLRVVDEYWMDHIDAMTDLRQGIGLRAYAQTDPIIAYKKESLEMFEEMISAIQEETVRRLYSVRLRKNEEVKRERVAKTTSESVGGDGTVKKQPRKVKKIGRNEPCPCGSGKKYKNCCGRDA